MFKKSPPSLPPLMMIPIDGEYHIVVPPKKKSWFEKLLQEFVTTLIWLVVILFIYHFMYITYLAYYA